MPPSCRAQDLARSSWEAERAEVRCQLDVARWETGSTASVRHEAEKACREQDSAIESSRCGWQVSKDAEFGKERVLVFLKSY